MKKPKIGIVGMDFGSSCPSRALRAAGALGAIDVADSSVELCAVRRTVSSNWLNTLVTEGLAINGSE